MCLLWLIFQIRDGNPRLLGGTLVSGFYQLLCTQAIVSASGGFSCFCDSITKFLPFSVPRIIRRNKFEDFFRLARVVRLALPPDQALWAIVTTSTFQPQVSLAAEDFQLEK